MGDGGRMAAMFDYGIGGSDDDDDGDFDDADVDDDGVEDDGGDDDDHDDHDHHHDECADAGQMWCC